MHALKMNSSPSPKFQPTRLDTASVAQLISTPTYIIYAVDAREELVAN